MSPLSAWLARRKRRRAVWKLMRQLIAGAKRSVAFERKFRESFIDFCETDFAAIWADYAAELDKDVEGLTIEEKKRAHMNYLLRDSE